MKKVPEAWRSFLQDQRGPWLQSARLTRHSLSLSCADKLELSPKEKEAVEKERQWDERLAREAQQQKRAKERSVRKKRSF